VAHSAKPFKSFLEETCGRFRVALALDKNVEDIAILIDSRAKIMRLAADFDEKPRLDAICRPVAACADGLNCRIPVQSVDTIVGLSSASR